MEKETVFYHWKYAFCEELLAVSPFPPTVDLAEILKPKEGGYFFFFSEMDSYSIKLCFLHSGSPLTTILVLLEQMKLCVGFLW